MSTTSSFADASVQPGSEITRPAYEGKTSFSRALLEMTAAGQQGQEKVLRLINDPGVTPEILQRLFEDLARGVDYIFDRYGTTFDKCCIPENGDIYLLWNQERNIFQFVVGGSFIKEACAYYKDPDLRMTQSKTSPHYLRVSEMMFLYGVEEAYHQHQLRTKLEEYRPYFQPLQDMENPRADYGDNLIERDAELVVRAAATELGYFPVSRATVCVSNNQQP
jgi:hypothetical protein